MAKPMRRAKGHAAVSLGTYQRVLRVLGLDADLYPVPVLRMSARSTSIWISIQSASPKAYAPLVEALVRAGYERCVGLLPGVNRCDQPDASGGLCR